MAAPDPPTGREVTVRAFLLDFNAIQQGAPLEPRLPMLQTAAVQWGVRRLFTYLAQRCANRPLDELRQTLLAGGVETQVDRVEWDPVSLTDAEFAALIESLPGPLPPDEAGVTFGPSFLGWRLRVPADAPLAILSSDQVEVRAAGVLTPIGERAAYAGFDRHEWGDVYDAPARPDDCARLLEALGAAPTSHASLTALAERLGSAAPGYVAEYGRMLNARQPDASWRRWLVSLSRRRLEKRFARWTHSMLPHAVARLGGIFRFVVRRESEADQWAPADTAFTTFQ